MMNSLTVALALGTVWGRFHYVSDVIVGGIIGVAAIWMTGKLMPESGQTNDKVTSERKLVTNA
jgi:membrane-associated phospholipid phosphatase